MAAALGIFLGLAALLTMTHARRQVDDEEQPRLYRWLHLGRVLMVGSLRCCSSTWLARCS